MLIASSCASSVWHRWSLEAPLVCASAAPRNGSGSHPGVSTKQATARTADLMGLSPNVDAWSCSECMCCPLLVGPERAGQIRKVLATCVVADHVSPFPLTEGLRRCAQFSFC